MASVLMAASVASAALLPDPAALKVSPTTIARDALPGPSVGLGRTGGAWVPPALIRADAPGPLVPDFFSSYLSPRLSARLDGLRSRIQSAHLGGSPFDFTTVESLSSEARSGSLRGAEAALRGWVLERTALDRIVFDIGRGGARSVSEPPSDGARVGFGFAGIVPRVDVVCPTAAGDLRLRVAARGDVSMEMQAGTTRWVHLGASADPWRNRYGMSVAGRF